MRRRLVVLIWLVVMLTLTPGRPPARAGVVDVQGVPEQVRVLGSGFAVAPPFADEDPATTPRRVTVAFVIENPNPDLAAEGLQLDVRLLDQGGMPLWSSSLTVAQLLPGERRNLIDDQTLGPTRPQVDSVEATVAQVLRWRRVGTVPVPAVQLRPPLGRGGIPNIPGLGSIHIDFNSPGGLVGVTAPTATATITNTLDAFVAGLDVAAVAFDQEGRIIGGGQTTRALAPYASAEVTAVMTISPGINAIARVEVTAAYPWIDLGPYAR